MNWYLKVLKQYADFSGRARRKEYWMFVLFNMIFTIVTIFFDNILGLTAEDVPFGVIYLLYALAVSIPGLAVTVRRLHDVGKNGWMILISLIPLIGGIWLLVILLSDSEPDENKYGANPKKCRDIELVSNVSIGDSVVFLALIWAYISTIFWPLLYSLPVIVDYEYDYNQDNLKPVQYLMNLIGALLPMGLAFAIKDKLKRLVSYALGALIFIYSIFNMVTQIIDEGNGLMILTAVLPTIGAIWLLLLMVKSSSDENKNVANPKENRAEGLDTDTIKRTPADFIILPIVIWMFLSHLYFGIKNEFYPKESFKILQLIISIIGALIPIGYAFAIKNKSTRVVSFVLGSILAIIGLAGAIILFTHL